MYRTHVRSRDRIQQNPQGPDQEEDQMQMANLQLSVRLSLLLAAVCVVFLLIGGSADADIPTPAPVEYLVESGDTLWAIASGIADPGQDVRRLVADISRLSQIDGGSIFPGQILLVPAG
jgi:nucleoid-associated protein YgaU